MVKALLSSVLVLSFCASAHAAPSATSKQAAPSPARTYWLSDGLNRLVFWQAPTASSQAEKNSRH